MRDSKGKFKAGHIPWHKGKKFVWKKKICPVCKLTFEAPKYKDKTYCSKKCSGKANGYEKGKTSWNKGTKGVMKSNKTSFKKGQVAPTKGVKYSEERIISMSGANSSRWQGGKTPYSKRVRNSKRFKQWRESVFNKDNYTCRVCKQKGIMLHSHHIFSFTKYPELRFITSNGTTMCKDCHSRIHRRHGKTLALKDYIRFLQYSTLFDHSAGSAW